MGLSSDPTVASSKTSRPVNTGIAGSQAKAIGTPHMAPPGAPVRVAGIGSRTPGSTPIHNYMGGNTAVHIVHPE
jgi:hypothetical protein